MVNQNSQFFAVLTNVGVAKQANADALGVPWKITQMGVGDANDTDPIPSAAQTKLINERRRAPLNQLKVDPANAAIIIAEQVIPAEVGGFWIREVGLYDADNDLVAVANCAPTFKPLLNQGSGRTQVIRINLQVSNSSNVELKIDPSVVLATRKYVDDSIINVLPADKAPGTYTKVTINARGIVVGGSNPTTLAGHNIVDAMSKGEGGLGTTAPLATQIRAIATTSFFTATTATADRPGGLSYAAGMHIKYPDAGYAIDFLGGIDAEFFGVRRVDDSGAGVWRTLWHSGNFDPTQYPKKQTTLAGYGIDQATQPEAEAGAENTKPVTVLRVWQAIAKAVVQATESALGLAKIATQPQTNSGADDTTFVTPKKLSAALVALIIQATETIKGIARIATQAETNAGSDDATIVTPKKLRWGFNASFQANGYIVFPAWLGAFIIQWGAFTLNTSISTSVAYVSFPLGFTTNCYHIGGMIGISTTDYDASPTYRSNRQSISFGVPTLSGCTGQAFMDNNTADARRVLWLALGR